jgi:hypothetical protein
MAAAPAFADERRYGPFYFTREELVAIGAGCDKLPREACDRGNLYGRIQQEVISEDAAAQKAAQDAVAQAASKKIDDAVAAAVAKISAAILDKIAEKAPPKGDSANGEVK